MAMPLHKENNPSNRIVAHQISKQGRDLTVPRHQRLVLALGSPRASTMRLLRNGQGALNVIQVRVTMAGAVLCDRFAGLSTR